MADELIPTLTKFHRDIVLPDMQRLNVDLPEALRLEFAGHFDAIYQRFDKLETEYHMIVVGLKGLEERMDRMEQRMDRIEQRLDKVALRSELLELKARVDGLQQQVRSLEARLEE